MGDLTNEYKSMVEGVKQMVAERTDAFAKKVHAIELKAQSREQDNEVLSKRLANTLMELTKARREAAEQRQRAEEAEQTLNDERQRIKQLEQQLAHQSSKQHAMGEQVKALARASGIALLDDAVDKNNNQSAPARAAPATSASPNSVNVVQRATTPGILGKRSSTDRVSSATPTATRVRL